MDDSRRIINFGPHGTIMQGFANDQNRRYDQSFDSQSRDLSYTNSQRNVPEVQFGHSTTQQPLARTNTEPAQFHSNFQAYHHGNTTKSPQRLIKDVQGNIDSRPYYSSTSLHHPPQLQPDLAYKSHQLQLEAIPSMTHKLEDSIKAPNRAPKHIPDLTAFLKAEHYRKFGVVGNTQDALFKLWKQNVSEFYRKKREQKINSKYGGVGATQVGQSFDQNQLGLSFKSKMSAKENITENHNEKSLAYQYKLFENLYEMDVIFTIEKDMTQEQNEYKQKQLQDRVYFNEKEKKQRQQYEEKEIRDMLTQFYEDLKEYEMSLIKEREERAKHQAHHESPKWHKGHSQLESLNPVESMEEEKKEPKKPQMTSNFEKDKLTLEADIKRQFEFMQGVMFLSREVDLSNDPKVLLDQYIHKKKSLNIPEPWMLKDDAQAKELLSKFFQPEFFLKRVMLTLQKKKKLDTTKNISLTAHYLQIDKRIKLLNMIAVAKSTALKIINEYEQFQRQLGLERRMMEDEDRLAHAIRDRKKLLKQVLGQSKAKKLEETEKKHKKEDGDRRIEELAKPKDKWKRGKQLMELKEKFPHDMVLEKMIKEEFKENKVFKYPEEYDLFDDDEDQACKQYIGERGLQRKELGRGKSLRAAFKQKDDQELYYEQLKTRNEKGQERELERFIVQAVQDYLSMKKKRLQGEERETIRQYLSTVYQKMLKLFPDQCHKRFPHLTYGTKKNSETYKKSFPTTFKRYFFRLTKSFVKTKGGGMKRLKHVPTMFIMPGGKRCTIHQYECPEDCHYTTLNKKILLQTTIAKRKEREPGTFRSRVWRRRDYKKKLNNVLMLNSEISNCTFEPEAGSMGKHHYIALRANPNLQKEGFLDEPDPESYFQKLGKNFESSHPEVYKAGILKRAKLKYNSGLYEQARSILSDGFNIESIKKRYDPHFMQRFMAEALLKAKRERIAKENEQAQKSGINRIFLQKEAPEAQNTKPQEDFENSKLLPVLREAFDLITTIEKHTAEAQKQIKNIQKSQKKLRTTQQSFSKYKRAQTMVDTTKEKILFRTIMCPLKEKCQKAKMQRWPQTNIKSNTKFGEECPFAHHPMELMFPESILTKIASNTQMIKTLEKKIVEHSTKKVFKPAGRLFECVGCNQRCNLCKYKAMAHASTLKFNDKGLKQSLMRSMEKRESVDVQKEKEEMSVVRKQLDIDTKYTKKFGLFKKACVLFFYGRYNDSFDVIAKAASIIQDDKEIEKQKQGIIERRWKFKLGLDDGFELPIPIEQIDPSKVDEKFLKKMDMPGVSLSTVKLYIEQVSPLRTEEFSKHQYLNKCIEDFYLQCEEAIVDKQETIKKMKKNVEELDREADEADAFASSPERSPDKDGEERTIKKKKKKLKMCPTFMEKGSCPQLKEKKCQYAHNPIELDLIPVESKMKNLNGVILSQSIKLKNMKPIEPWRPAKAGEIEHTHLMDMASKKRKSNNDEDEDEGSKRKEKVHKSIFERENIFKKPYEKE